MNGSLKQQKRDYLSRVVDQLLASGRYKYRKEIAAALGDTEQALSSKLAGDRGLTDDFIDTVATVTGIPFMPVAPDQNMEEITAEVAELRKSVNTVLSLVAQVLQRMPGA